MISLFLKSKKGFSFIDVLVGISLMLIVFLGIFGAYQLSLKVISQSKARITATSFVNQELEMIRNLPYKQIGTTPHLIDEPAGEIPKTSSTTQNNIGFAIETKIIYINDCFDGPRSSDCPQAPEIDSCPRDYKRATIKVSWQKPSEGEVILATNIAPRNLNQEEEECTGEVAGVLSVSVFDALGAAVLFPLIEIINPDTDSTLTSFSPPSGKHEFVLSPATYKVRVSKPGYSSHQTFWTGDVYNGKTIAEPVKSHPAVYGGRLTEIGLSIDGVSSMMIEARGSKGQGYPPIHNATFKTEGVKTVGNDSQGNPIYKYSQSYTTNGPAEINLSNLEWDSYSFSVDSPDYDLVDIESPPGTTTTQPIDLLPNSTEEVRLILKAENTLLVTVQDASTTQAIFGAEVRLYNTDLEYDVIQPTGEDGKTFFIPLKENSYNLEVAAPNYADSATVVSVSGDTTKTVNLFFLPQ